MVCQESQPHLKKRLICRRDPCFKAGQEGTMHLLIKGRQVVFVGRSLWRCGFVDSCFG